ncbi:DUF262 domain-containing protein [Leptospira selangorensis]|uniref:DUF262 domain-containing protein n=1 Tax=Leptospira selangorensis TaxID=2484982 RepID=A0ABY2NAD9_9LEPT|nr:DUF262 domain-containing protein [Leptospira selangorensis]
MSVLQQSSKAQDRELGVWFQNIKLGYIKLPRFQRYEAWDKGRISSFLNTIINNLPVGVTLSLEVDPGKEQFLSRYISTAEPESPERNTVNQHLLDGQQRLTALWRSMHNNYEWQTYFIQVQNLGKANDLASVEMEVFCQSRWKNKANKRMPAWADNERLCFERNLFPIHLLQPGDTMAIVDDWIFKATNHLHPSEQEENAYRKLEEYNKLKEKIKSIITAVRERVAHFNLPYLSLPASTKKDVALQVFINMNTNSKPLALYDIIVAEVEEVAGKSLHDLEEDLVEKCPKANRFGEIRNLILATSALLQDKLPNNRGMIEMNKRVLLDNWPKLEIGIERMAELLDSQAVFDASRLPTNAVLAVISALYDVIPETGDYKAKAERLLRSYLWTAFLTDRYDNSASTRAYADFKALKVILSNEQFTDADFLEVPIFKRDEFPIVTVDEMLSEGWPKAVGIIPRGILAVTNFFGAEDFADGQTINSEHIKTREYHHLFPDALLKEAAIDSYLALNCALITWKTNRVIGRKNPLEYLRERIDWSSENEVRRRLKTHLIPWEVLASATYSDFESTSTKEKIRDDFKKFLSARASLVQIAVNKLVTGEKPSLDEIWRNYEGQE